MNVRVNKPWNRNGMDSLIWNYFVVNKIPHPPNDLFTLDGTGTGTGNWISTIGNNGSRFLSLSQISVNISVQYIRTQWSQSLYPSRSHSREVLISHNKKVHPAWTQEAYRPPCSEYSFCCPTSVPPLGQGTPPRKGYPPPRVIFEIGNVGAPIEFFGYFL